MTAFAPSGQSSADSAGPATRRPVVLGALGAGALAAAGLLLLTGGAETPDAALAATPAVVAPPALAAPSPSTAPATPVAAASSAGRDPFQPLHATGSPVAPAGAPAPQAPAAAGAPAGTTPVAVPAVPAVPAVAVPTGPGPAAPDPAAPPTAVPVPVTPVPRASADPEGPTLVLHGVEGAGSSRTAVFALDGTMMRAQVGGSFGPGDALLLLSLQRATDGRRWTALVQHGSGDPFDLVSGTHVHLR